MFQYDRRNSGSSGGSAPSAGNRGDAVRFRTRPGDPVYSSPAVVDGTAYIGSGRRVVAVDASDGVHLWSTETTGAVRSSPAVVDGTAFVGTRANLVYALDAEDGTERWRAEANAGSTPRQPSSAGPSTSPAGRPRGRVYALDAEDGTEQWRFETDYRVISSPAVANGTVYVGGWDTAVYALDAETGPNAGVSRPTNPCSPRPPSSAEPSTSAETTTRSTPSMPTTGPNAGGRIRTVSRRRRLSRVERCTSGPKRGRGASTPSTPTTEPNAGGSASGRPSRRRCRSPAERSSSGVGTAIYRFSTPATGRSDSGGKRR